MSAAPSNPAAGRSGRPDSPAPEALSRESLLELFQPLVEKNYSAVGLRDAALAVYTAHVLAAFVRPAAIYAVRNGRGRRPETLEGMLAASDPLQAEGGSFEREAAVRRHIGDFALFFTGMFPESLRGRRGDDRLLEFITAGKESYQIVSVYERTRGECELPAGWAAMSLPVAAENVPQAPLFAALASEFERCMYGLNRVKSEIASFGDPAYQVARELLM